MAVKTNGGSDDRVERILKDPSGYFAQARRRARAEVRQEMAREQEQSRKRLRPA